MSENKKKRDKAYREAHKEELKQKRKIYREANREKEKNYYISNKEKISNSKKENREHHLEYGNAQYRLKFKERQAYSKVYHENNKEVRNNNVRTWQKNNNGKTRFYCAKRHTSKLQATPKWLTDEHWKKIEEFYILAQQKEKETGIKYHVDHICPLQGKTVCGLHVPWNLQVLTAEENYRKHNTLDNAYFL